MTTYRVFNHIFRYFQAPPWIEMVAQVWSVFATTFSDLSIRWNIHRSPNRVSDDAAAAFVLSEVDFEWLDWGANDLI